MKQIMLLMNFMVIPTGLYAEVAVRVNGPQQAKLQDEIEYVVNVSNPGACCTEMLCFYCYVPRGLTFVSAKEAKNSLPISYAKDFKRIYGEIYDFSAGNTMRIAVTFKVDPELHVSEGEKAEIPFYFTFIVAENGEEKEFSKKKVLSVIPQNVLCAAG